MHWKFPFKLHCLSGPEIIVPSTNIDPQRVLFKWNKASGDHQVIQIHTADDGIAKAQ